MEEEEGIALGVAVSCGVSSFIDLQDALLKKEKNVQEGTSENQVETVDKHHKEVLLGVVLPVLQVHLVVVEQLEQQQDVVASLELELLLPFEPLRDVAVDVVVAAVDPSNLRRLPLLLLRWVVVVVVDEEEEEEEVHRQHREEEEEGKLNDKVFQ